MKKSIQSENSSETFQHLGREGGLTLRMLGARPTAGKHVPYPVFIPGEENHIPTTLCSRTSSEKMALMLLHSPDKSI